MKLSCWRRHNKMTQKQVADAVGVDHTMVSKYERKLAKPTLDHLAIIHKLTNRQVTVEDFLYGTDGGDREAVGDHMASENTVQCICGGVR